MSHAIPMYTNRFLTQLLFLASLSSLPVGVEYAVDISSILNIYLACAVGDRLAEKRSCASSFLFKVSTGITGRSFQVSDTSGGYL